MSYKLIGFDKALSELDWDTNQPDQWAYSIDQDVDSNKTDIANINEALDPSKWTNDPVTGLPTVTGLPKRIVDIETTLNTTDGLPFKITKNEGNISTNRGNISTNRGNISTNRGNIKKNKRDITKNTEAIDELNKLFSSLPGIESNIKKNKSDIEEIQEIQDETKMETKTVVFIVISVVSFLGVMVLASSFTISYRSYNKVRAIRAKR